MTDLTTVLDVAVTTMTERAVGAGFGMANGLRRQRPTDGGSEDERAAAAIRFTRAVIDYRTTLTVLAGVRATLSGAIITVPLLLRQINRIQQVTTDVTDAYAAFYMVGTAPVLEKADAVLHALDRANDIFHAAPRRERARRVTEALVDVDAAIAALVAAVRADRRFRPVDERTT